MEIGCMASFSDVVEALLLPETEEVDQQAKACEADEGALAAAATMSTEEDEAATTLQQEQRDDGEAPEHAAEAPAAAPAPPPEEHDGDEKKDQQVAKEEEVEQEHTAAAAAAAVDQEMSTRERLKRHRREMAGTVWVPEMWGQEKLLKDWVDCAVFDRPMVPTGLLTARRALIAECCSARRRPDRTSPSSSTTSSNPLRVRNGCS